MKCEVPALSFRAQLARTNVADDAPGTPSSFSSPDSSSQFTGVHCSEQGRYRVQFPCSNVSSQFDISLSWARRSISRSHILISGSIDRVEKLQQTSLPRIEKDDEDQLQFQSLCGSSFRPIEICCKSCVRCQSVHVGPRRLGEGQSDNDCEIQSKFQVSRTRSYRWRRVCRS